MVDDAYGLDEVEMERHAECLAAGNPDFGTEASVTFPNGFSMRTAAYPASADYVRVCAPDGIEIAYFDKAEFVRSTEETLTVLFVHVDRKVDAEDLPVASPSKPGDNPYSLLPTEIVHQKAAGAVEYEDEGVLVNVANGFQMRIPTGSLVDYVRICDPSGKETAYWSIDEFGEDPAEVIGAMMGAIVRGH